MGSQRVGHDWVTELSDWLNGARCHDLNFFFLFVCFSYKLALPLSSFTLIKKIFSSSLLSAIKMLLSAYLRLLMLLLLILIAVCNSASLGFCMMCSTYRLNKQGNTRQGFHTPFSILNQPIVPYKVLTVASSPAYRFLRRKVRWPGIIVSLRAFHSSLWSEA